MKNKKFKKLLIIVCTLFLLTGCTTQLKDSNKKPVVNETTGQVLTKNIFCKPTDSETIKQYTTNLLLERTTIEEIMLAYVKERG